MKKVASTDRLLEIEWIRAISCLLVIVIHVTAEFWNGFTPGSIQYKMIIVLNTISKFVVPCFVFLSGFVLYYVYHNRECKTLDFYKKRIFKVIIPYLVWSGIYILINYKYSNYSIDLKSIIKYIILGRANTHLYFMILIIQLYAIFPWCLKVYKKINNKTLSMGLFSIANIILILFIKMPFKDRFFINYLMFFGLGFLLAELKVEKFTANNTTKSIIFSLYFIITSYYLVDTYKYTAQLPFISKSLYRYAWWAFSLISIIVIYMLANMLKSKKYNLIDNKIVNSLSKHSFAIYLSHMFFIKGIRVFKGFSQLKNYSMTVAFIFQLIAVICMSWLFGIVLEKLRSTLGSCIVKKDYQDMNL